MYTSENVKVIKKDGTSAIVPAINLRNMERVQGHNIKKIVPIHQGEEIMEVETKVATPKKTAAQVKPAKMDREEMEYRARLYKIKGANLMSDSTLLDKIKKHELSPKTTNKK